MGCESCKTVTVIPITTVKNDTQLFNTVKCTQQQKTTSEVVEANIPQIIRNRKPSSQSDEFIRQSRTPKKSPSNHSKEVTILHATDMRPKSTKTTKSNDHPEFIPQRMSSEQQTHDDTDVNPVSTTVEEIVMRRKSARPIVVESILSDTSDETILSITSSESDDSHFYYDDIVSSSSTNTEKTVLRQNTMIRFTSARVNNSNTHQKIFYDDMPDDSDESYPLHESIVTSSSSDIEELSMQQETTPQSTSADIQKSQVQQNIIANDIFNESDATGLRFQPITKSSNSGKVMEHRDAVIKSTSSNRKKSDIHKKTTAYETSSESSEY